MTKNIVTILLMTLGMVAGILHRASDEVVFMTLYTAIILAFMPEK